ncbi:hypothetical protein HXX76_003418 [Chlamydomonas incerta]|uniref:Alpha 1,4-glycosyltransferase domain-containing protein n=1 Tax=Chlamydomonas incerta TaxID=51695 RepID=A0A835W8P2_CHLIN|nr:hypothetical protein HXX76_003418 [Chlamydomonas incerta]|eukprot:KAG2441808.1 hypothetical protein HXX76_003418 [Chlamydomonas incerta]
MKPRSVSSAALLSLLTAVALLCRCSAVVEYRDHRKHLDEGGPDFNVYLIWTTKASTLDELAIQAITSVVEAYKPLREELRKEAAERAAAASRIGSAKRNKTPEGTEQAAAFAAAHALAPGGLHLFANKLDDEDLASRGWGGPGGTGLTLVHYVVHDVLEDTPLGSWFKQKEEKLRTGKFYFSHITDMMRFALVYKHGGLYLDADVIMMRPISLSHLNAVVRPPHTMIECAVVYFSAGHPFIWKVLTHIKNNYAINDWTTAGPRALTVAYDDYTFHGPNRDVYDLPLRLAAGTYYGLRLEKAKDFWNGAAPVPEDFAGCEAVHVWGSIARGYLSHTGRKDYYLDQEHRQRVRQRVAALRAVPGCAPDAPRLAPGESGRDIAKEPGAAGAAGPAGQAAAGQKHKAAAGAAGAAAHEHHHGVEGVEEGAGAPPPEEVAAASGPGSWEGAWSAAFGDSARNPQHVEGAAAGEQEQERPEARAEAEAAEAQAATAGGGGAAVQRPAAVGGEGDQVAADVMRGLLRDLSTDGDHAAAAAATSEGADGRGGRALPPLSLVVNYTDVRQWLDDGNTANIFLTWTTGPETLDALAVECISSVINTYAHQYERRGAAGGVFLLANTLGEADVEAHGWGRPGVHLVRYVVAEVLQDTPVGSWYVAKRAELEAGKFWFSHVTDLMRFALVYKHGGIYMDTDVLVMRPISAAHVNKLVRAVGDSSCFECAVMFFEAGHSYLFEVLKQIPRHYRGTDWVSAGPKALTIVYDHGPVHALHDVPDQVVPGVYLGIRLQKAKRFWMEGHIRTEDFIGCEVIHLWGSTARGYVTKKSTTYITGQEQEERLKQRVDALRQISWCRSRAPRFDKCANITACTAKEKSLAVSSRKSTGEADEAIVGDDGESEGWDTRAEGEGGEGVGEGGEEAGVRAAGDEVGDDTETWTTGPETLDALAVECISSVINAYARQFERPGAHGGVYLLANHLTEEKMEELGWKRRGVYLTRYSVEDVLQDTPVGSWYVAKRAELEAGKFWFSHVTDLMRFALVYKHGGIYMDTDVLVMRPISPSHVNKLVRALSDSNWFECAVMFFHAGHPYLFEVLKQIPRHYRAVDWISAGPKALTIVYDHGPVHSMEQLPGRINPGVYLGIRLTKAKRFWKEGHIRTKDFIGCEVIHLWGSTARGYVIKKSTTYITGQEQEERLKQRVDVLRQISWCKHDAPRLDKCGNATECSEAVTALAAAPKPPAPGGSDDDGSEAGGDAGGEQGGDAEEDEAQEEEDPEEDEEEVPEADDEAGDGERHRVGGLELEQGEDGEEDGGSELRRGIWSVTGEWGQDGGR